MFRALILTLNYLDLREHYFINWKIYKLYIFNYFIVVFHHSDCGIFCDDDYSLLIVCNALDCRWALRKHLCVHYMRISKWVYNVNQSTHEPTFIIHQIEYTWPSIVYPADRVHMSQHWLSTRPSTHEPNLIIHQIEYIRANIDYPLDQLHMSQL